jgi:hypothetical protein
VWDRVVPYLHQHSLWNARTILAHIYRASRQQGGHSLQRLPISVRSLHVALSIVRFVMPSCNEVKHRRLPAPGYLYIYQHHPSTLVFVLILRLRYYFEKRTRVVPTKIFTLLKSIESSITNPMQQRFTCRRLELLVQACTHSCTFLDRLTGKTNQRERRLRILTCFLHS